MLRVPTTNIENPLFNENFQGTFMSNSNLCY